MSVHEDLSRDEETSPASDRQFARVFIVGWSLIGLAPLLHGRPVRWWAVLLAAAVSLLWLVRPRWLTPLNRVWVGLGAVMGRVTTPLVTGLLFFLCVTPLALLYRVLGKDPLARRFDRAAPSYWIERRPPGPLPESMPRQF
jgi:Saxitoxin biosynthesis operon protein SxtJ